MSGPEFVEAFLDSWMVESDDFTELQIGQDVEMSLDAHVRALDGVVEVPAEGAVPTGGPTREIEGEVTWVRHDEQGLHLIVQHAGTVLAAQAAMFQGPRRRTWRDRLLGRLGVPEFLPVQLPVPEIGQSVTLECTIGVMADYELEEFWPGPDVSARYRVESIDVELVTPQPMSPGADEFDLVPYPPSRMVTGLSSTRPPADYIEFDFTAEGEPIGEHLSGYRLLLTPLDPLPDAASRTTRS